MLIGVLGFCTPFCAQNLDTMNETERKATLLRIAKEGVLEFGPDYYREYGEPEIEHGYVGENPKQYFTDEEFEKYKNRSFYSVKYFYDKNEEAFHEDYSAWVYIWGDTGKVFAIRFGIGMGLGDLDDPEVVANPGIIKRAEWQKRPPGSLNTHRAIYVEEVPPPSDSSLRKWAIKGLVSESELQEAKRRGLVSESEAQEIENKYLAPRRDAKKKIEDAKNAENEKTE